MFRKLMKDQVTVKTIEGKTYTDIDASVQRNKIIMWADIPIRPGDQIIRQTSAGVEEIFIVEDPGFHSRVGRIPANYQIRVRLSPSTGPTIQEGGARAKTTQKKEQQMVTEQNKDDLLEVIYRMSPNLSNNVSLIEMKIHFGRWDDSTFWDTAKALLEDNLITERGRGWCALTLEGRRRAEKSLNPPPIITHNTVNASSINDASIQQGGAHSAMTQMVSYNRDNLNDLRHLVEVFETRINELKLDEIQERKARAQVATIKAQLEDEPDPVIVKKAGLNLRTITEGAIGNIIAVAATQPAIWVGVYHIMQNLF